MGLLSWIVVGLIAGWLAGLVMHSGFGIIGDMILGIVGGLLGGFLASLLGVPFNVNGINLESILVAFAGAVFVLILVRAMNRSQRAI